MRKKHELTMTAGMVHHYRHATGCGLGEAKAIISADLSLAKLEHLIKEGTIEEKLDYLLKSEAQALHRRLFPQMAPPIVQPEAVGTYNAALSDEAGIGIKP